MTRLLSIALLAATLSATDQTLTIPEHALAAKAWKCGMLETGIIARLNEETTKTLKTMWGTAGCEILRRQLTGTAGGF